tara:strand:- start:689 stop:970 length:282 start_codon:yes stop_codon:yes gene_type:complete
MIHIIDRPYLAIERTYMNIPRPVKIALSLTPHAKIFKISRFGLGAVKAVSQLKNLPDTLNKINFGPKVEYNPENMLFPWMRKPDIRLTLNTRM